MGEEFVTQNECEDRRKVIYDRLDKNENEIADLKLVVAEIRVSLSAVISIGKAIFVACAGGMATIITILLTRGI